MNPLAARSRWWIVGVFVLSSAINYLDRQSLATLAPLLKTEFQLSNTDYGYILTAFSVSYALCAPLAGLFIDRIGLNLGISLAVGLWSVAGIATGLTHGLAGLVFCRTVLGLAEAGGIPAAGKAIHQYLRPPERALGNALNQAGVSLGAILAPPVATWIAVRHGWRMAFVVTGLLGLFWIPLWLRISHGVKAGNPGTVQRPLEILRDRRLWGFVAANALSMIVYSLWTNWTTLYLVDVEGLTFTEAAWFAWIPPLFATAGGVAGGWLSLHWMSRGVVPLTARKQVCLVGALGSLVTAVVPLLPGPGWAATGISLSILSVAAFSVNMYTMPLDAFGGARAAFAVSLLVAAYGGIQAVISPAFGALIDAYGYTPVCLFASIMPLTGYGVLQMTEP